MHLAIDAIERLTTYGMVSNLMAYLLIVLFLDQVDAINFISLWIEAYNVIPITVAFVADVFLGKSRTMYIYIIICKFCGMLSSIIVLRHIIILLIEISHFNNFFVSFKFESLNCYCTFIVRGNITLPSLISFHLLINPSL